jgi:patatin-like phospholipase
MFDAVVFAGGGNRCYWQGGFYEAAASRIGLTPRLVVGASAGAFAATYSLLEMGPATRARVIGACHLHLKNFDVAAWRKGQPLCPVGPMYAELLERTVDAGALARLQTMTDLQIAVGDCRADCHHHLARRSASAPTNSKNNCFIRCIRDLAVRSAFVPSMSPRAQ